MSAAVPRVERLRHGKIDLALHHLRGTTDAGARPDADAVPRPDADGRPDAGTDADGGADGRVAAAGPAPARPLLLLHGLGERSPAAVPSWAEGWPGPVAALDFTGHGDSTVPRGGGYTAELLLADADVALAALTDGDPNRAITVAGRGLGAYVALQLAGARAPQVHGAILTDGPGLAGGPTGPTSQSFFSLPSTGTAPDPYALVELSRDLRPPDYAASFVRLALAGSSLDEPIAVCSIFRPAWLEAIAAEHGVLDVPLAEALELYTA